MVNKKLQIKKIMLDLIFKKLNEWKLFKNLKLTSLLNGNQQTMHELNYNEH